MPIAAKTAIKINATAAKTIKAACPIPASATIHPERRKTMTPKILIRHDVKTPSHVPKRTRSDTRKCDSHQGWALDPCSNGKSFLIYLSCKSFMSQKVHFTSTICYGDRIICVKDTVRTRIQLGFYLSMIKLGLPKISFTNLKYVC